MAGTSSSSNASTGHIPKPFPLISIVVQSSIAKRTTRLDLNLGDPIDNSNNGIRASLAFRLIQERNTKRKAKKSKRSNGSKRKTLTLVLSSSPAVVDAGKGGKGKGKGHRQGAPRWKRTHPWVHARAGWGPAAAPPSPSATGLLTLLGRGGETVGEKRKETHRRHRLSPTRADQTAAGRPHAGAEREKGGGAAAQPLDGGALTLE
uniref:Uncharacterized protein n=1 Tax=Oryza sativa subsp. japonica TaxID=39947 RepID=Q6H4D1_ORYSJ|nr:hypothetical protein [Oryza sativa Japonica Group]